MKGKIILIRRAYIVKSKELRKLFDIEGEITHIGLWRGRSPNEVEQGKSADLEEWEILTEEKKGGNRG